MRDFLLNFYKEASNRIANTQPKLQTNPPKIANKQNYEQTNVSESSAFSVVQIFVVQIFRVSMLQTFLRPLLVLPILLLLEKGKENHQKNKEFSSLPNP